MLGTGTPIPDPDRFGPSTLVEAGNQKLLFDAGRGATIRLRQINMTKGTIMSKVDALFLTHYHSDHTLGIPDLWLTGWLNNSRKEPFRLIGPVGAKSLMTSLEAAYALDIKIRLEDEKLSPEGIATVVEEFEKDGVVYDRDDVKVIAFTVDHGAAIKPAVGYRIEYKGRAVVISGDTRYDQNVIKYSAGVDLLIHEVCVARTELLSSNPYMRRVMDHHTSPREAGQVFSLAKPKLAVYSHLVFLGSDKIPRATVEDIVAGTRETYDGPLQVGADLMSFEIGHTVIVRQRNP
ncbi:MBL fold metallo-hydrolase [Bradyrhizobium jicamae]|uniref:MBL fold metallo-hydrolase n=1 Tax=Bradyrhizobium jicamae TaxID=280332 RepID=UPI0009F8CD9B|nr:MBL fold metallo-hydrolase [Bradyrhizobium jicamae]